MEITPAQFALIEHCLPAQRGNVSMSNLQFRRLKGYRRIFTRFETLDVMFLGFLKLCAHR
ncbi:hypothetical protein [Xanthomonas oryzae]|uniref:hypothetical protein n=1 Tax=Xanthomonas oryzae TaxID=347 RepID=UPI000AA2A113|nr:hypothetical protein [Xanthomonas oryzae]